ncbi:hypothetical protein [Vibrio tritonius]|uniref:hypothetical protein n=1 Tax=Vibrio tritonius TaxID=1435069 RepID=UPI00315C7D30
MAGKQIYIEQLKTILKEIDLYGCNLINFIGSGRTGKTVIATEAGWLIHNPKLNILDDNHNVSLERIMSDVKRDGEIFAIDEAQAVANLPKIIDVCAKRQARLVVISQVDLNLPKPYLRVQFERNQEPRCALIH